MHETRPAGPGFTRREFLRTAAVAAAAPAVAGALPGRLFAEAAPPAPAAKPLVVDAIDAAWLGADGAPDAAAIRAILDKGFRRVTGKGNVSDAIRSLVSPSETVLLKFNHVSENYHRCNASLVPALTAFLQDAGHPAEKIVVVEADGAQWNNPFPVDAPVGNGFTKLGEPIQWETGRTRVTRLASNQVDAILNVGDMKDHNLFGYTGAMKNITHSLHLMQGPHHFHPESKQTPEGFPCACQDAAASEFIRNQDPARLYPTFIPGLFRARSLGGKVRMNIVVGLSAIMEGGPTPRNPKDQFRHDGILFSKDAVAADRVGLEIVQEARKARKLPSLFRKRNKPLYIEEAGNAGLGVADLAGIDWARA